MLANGRKPEQGERDRQSGAIDRVRLGDDGIVFGFFVGMIPLFWRFSCFDSGQAVGVLAHHSADRRDVHYTG